MRTSLTTGIFSSGFEAAPAPAPAAGSRRIEAGAGAGACGSEDGVERLLGGVELRERMHIWHRDGLRDAEFTNVQCAHCQCRLSTALLPLLPPLLL